MNYRQNTPKQLFTEKEEYRQLFNICPIPQWIYDVETLRFLDVNEAAIKHYGYSKEEFLNMTIKDIRPKEDIAILQKIINESVKKGIFNRSPAKHLKKNGELIYVNIAGTPAVFKGRNSRLILSIDNTKELKARQALKVREQYFKTLVQDGSDIITILDSEGNCQYISHNSESILGIPAERFIRRNAFDFIHSEDRERVINQFSQLKYHKNITITPFRLHLRNNPVRWMETIVTDMTDDPTVAGIVANSRDVTSRIENESKVNESIERYNTVSKATSDAIYDWDILNNKMIWNKGLQGIFGHKQISTTHDWWFSHIHPDDAQKAVDDIQLLIKNKKSRMGSEYRFGCADGTYKYVLDRAFLIFNKADEPVRMIGAMQDITERVDYIRAIEEQNRRLRDIAWAQSHIVRAPLSRIMELTEMLRENISNDIAIEELLLLIKDSANELDTVIRRIVKKTREWNYNHKDNEY